MGLSEEDIRLVCEKFSKEYSKAKCALEFRNDFELLVSARLSAQCKDDRVNSISKVLFRKFPDVFSMLRILFVLVDFLELNQKI